MPQPERYYFTDFHTIGLKKKQVEGPMFKGSVNTVKLQKIISPGAYIFQRPFLRGLFLEGLIFGGAYIRREICTSKSTRLIPLYWEGNMPQGLQLEGNLCQ